MSSENHGKYLGVDYGDVRTGVAVCDPTGFLASGVCTLRERGMTATARKVADEARERGCVRIIVGLPKNMDGSEGARVDTVRTFVSVLSQFTDIPIDFCDERMTTVEAYRYLGESGTFGKARRNVVDTLSAEIILQNYIDRERAADKDSKL